jgi:HlyD family secretion protein
MLVPGPANSPDRHCARHSPPTWNSATKDCGLKLNLTAGSPKGLPNFFAGAQLQLLIIVYRLSGVHATSVSTSRKGSFPLKLLKSKWLILLLAVVAVSVFAAFKLTQKDKVELFTAKVERGDIRSVVEATGEINAVTSVQVGSQISGRIYRLYADFNSQVKKGQLLAEIDPALFQGAVLQSQADLENARASLAAAKANLLKEQANAQQTRADFARTEELTKQGVMSQQQLDVSKANSESSDAGVKAAQAQVNQSAAQVKQREAALTVAETNLRYTHIYAPIDGVVVSRAVDVGQTVAASMTAPTLFTIAQDLSQMQVYTKTDESDVGQIHPGQRVTFTVDAFPGQRFRGQVSQVRMNPTVVQNVVTYDTIINFQNPDMKLFPGMTAYVSIPVQAVQNVLMVPNGALRYTPDLPPEQLQAVLQQYGIQTGARRQQGADMASAEGSNSSDGPMARRAAQNAGAQPGASPEAPGAENAGNGRGRMAQAGGGAEASDIPGGGVRQRRGGRSTDVSVASSLGLVWKQGPDNTFIPVQIRKGLTDHTVTQVSEVTKGQLQEGDALIIGSRGMVNTTTAAPGMGGGRTGFRRGGG